MTGRLDEVTRTEIRQAAGIIERLAAELRTATLAAAMALQTYGAAVDAIYAELADEVDLTVAHNAGRDEVIARWGELRREAGIGRLNRAALDMGEWLEALACLSEDRASWPDYVAELLADD